jgi:hypothetical protein
MISATKTGPTKYSHNNPTLVNSLNITYLHSKFNIHRNSDTSHN